MATDTDRSLGRKLEVKDARTQEVDVQVLSGDAQFDAVNHEFRAMIDKVLNATSAEAVCNAIKPDSTTDAEQHLLQRIVSVVSKCTAADDARSRILELYTRDESQLIAVYGLLAVTLQERGLLTAAVLRSNIEREKNALAIRAVNKLTERLQDLISAKHGHKDARLETDIQGIVSDFSELTRNPSILYNELQDLRHEKQKYLDVQSCHLNLHEKEKKLVADHNELVLNFRQLKKKAIAKDTSKGDLARLQAQVNNLKNENTDLRQQLNLALSDRKKLNAVKFENTQLKKKLAAEITQAPSSQSKPPSGKDIGQKQHPIPSADSHPGLGISKIPQSSFSGASSSKENNTNAAHEASHLQGAESDKEYVLDTQKPSKPLIQKASCPNKENLEEFWSLFNALEQRFNTTHNSDTAAKAHAFKEATMKLLNGRAQLCPICRGSQNTLSTEIKFTNQIQPIFNHTFDRLSGQDINMSSHRNDMSLHRKSPTESFGKIGRTGTPSPERTPVPLPTTKALTLSPRWSSYVERSRPRLYSLNQDAACIQDASLPCNTNPLAPVGTGRPTSIRNEFQVHE